MIFYFSGTGNSQFVAIQLAKALDEELVSIGRGLRSGRMQTYHSEQPLVFVAPTYAWRMPRVVEQWIRQTTFQGNPDAYFVLTCGDDCGNAAAYAQRLCRQVGLRFCGLAPVVMPENYVAMFYVPGAEEAAQIIAAAQPSISTWRDDQPNSGEAMSQPRRRAPSHSRRALTPCSFESSMAMSEEYHSAARQLAVSSQAVSRRPRSCQKG